mmetsp:Transcript_519/g.1875  ORF Transcript_519/g.1875 Transcript_519/m.1875 type:complete len:216 (-) Transcript_519:1281-1928(-)
MYTKPLSPSFHDKRAGEDDGNLCQEERRIRDRRVRILGLDGGFIDAVGPALPGNRIKRGTLELRKSISVNLIKKWCHVLLVVSDDDNDRTARARVREPRRRQVVDEARARVRGAERCIARPRHIQAGSCLHHSNTHADAGQEHLRAILGVPECVLKYHATRVAVHDPLAHERANLVRQQPCVSVSIAADHPRVCRREDRRRGHVKIRPVRQCRTH